MNLLKKLAGRLFELHEGNKAQLEANQTTLETAEQQSQVVAAIKNDAEDRAQRLRAANHRNHYSEGLLRAIRNERTAQ